MSRVVNTSNSSQVKSSKKGTSSTVTKKKSTNSKKNKSTTTKRTSRNKVNQVDSLLSKSRKSKKSDLIEASSVLEYYDLPYRYNQTKVKILAQTPTILFVYWEISDIDRANLIEKYGNDFFNKTKPFLLIHNKTRDYLFEVEINDFANSWYLRMQEPNCEYELELRRRDIKNSSESIYISSSNELISPNDHVLFEETDFRNIKFKNVKTSSISQKDFGSIRLMTNVGNVYNKKHKVYSFYNNLYKDEVLESNKVFSNPSSSNLTSKMF